MSKLLLEKLEILANNYDMQDLINQIGVSNLEVLKLLWKRGLLDVDDFFGDDEQEWEE